MTTSFAQHRFVGAADAQQLAERVSENIASEVSEFCSDGGIRRLLDFGADDNLNSTLQVVRHLVDPSQVEPSQPGSEIARVFAQRGVPFNRMEHSCRIYHETILQSCLEMLKDSGMDTALCIAAAQDITSRVSAHINIIARQLLNTYEEQDESWRRRRSTSHMALIQDILSWRVTDISTAEHRLGYCLSATHLAVVLWIGNNDSSPRIDTRYIETAVRHLASELGSPSAPIIEMQDEKTAWAWIGFPDRALADRRPPQEIAAELAPEIYISFGRPHSGVSGFIQSHRQAVRSLQVLQHSKSLAPTAVGADDIGVLPLLCTDVDAAREWVHETLAPLRTAEAEAIQAISTLTAFYRSGCNYSATASALYVHKNTVLYRIQKIEIMLGRSVRSARLVLENALEFSYWLD